MTTSLFGRAWNIQVLTPPDSVQQQTLLSISSSDRETQSLRVTFHVEQTYSALWYAEVDIYNPNLQTIRALAPGCTVSVSAGYVVEGNPTEIFRGPLIQGIVSKPDQTTVRLRLICVVGLDELTNSVMRTTIGPGASQRETVLAMAANCFNADGSRASIPIAYLAPDSDFKAQPLPRSQTIFGTPNQLFARIAANNDMASVYRSDGLSIGRLDATKSAVPDVIYAPPITQDQTQPTSDAGTRYCLLGTPEQTDMGVSFRVQLDPRLTYKVPAMRAQLKNVVIDQQQYQVGQYPSVLTQDGVYFVSSVEHIGDTRGNEWESRVVAMSSINGLFPGGLY